MAFVVKNYLEDLETLVNMESFSTFPEGTARVAEWIRQRLENGTDSCGGGCGTLFESGLGKSGSL